MSAQGSEPRARAGRRVGRWTRLEIGGEVVLTVVLALAAVVALNWLAGRPGLRQRYDLTAARQNTLSVATIGVLSRLQETVTIDVFWRGEEAPLTGVAAEAMTRVYRLLQLVDVEGGDRVRIVDNARASREEIAERKRALKLTGFENCIVVSAGERREVRGLVGELAHLDPGNPDRRAFRPATILALPAEEVLVQAMLQVTRAEERRVYFTTGQGEPELGDPSPGGLSELRAALEDEALEALPWRFAETGRVPADAAAVAVLGPAAAFPPGQRAALEAWVDGGGRLLVAGAAEAQALERSDVPELLASYGIEIGACTLMTPQQDAAGQQFVGMPINATLIVRAARMGEHPVTSALKRAGRVVMLPWSHPLHMRRQPHSLERLAKAQGSTFPILQIDGAWCDLEPLDFRPHPEDEELGLWPLAVVSSFVPPEAELRPLERKPEARLFAIGSLGAFTNEWWDHDADLVRNAFSWVLSREYRVSISPRDPDERRLPLRDGDALARVSRVALYWLPGLCLALGVLTAFLRSRGGPTSHPG